MTELRYCLRSQLQQLVYTMIHEGWDVAYTLEVPPPSVNPFQFPVTTTPTTNLYVGIEEKNIEIVFYKRIALVQEEGGSLNGMDQG